MSELSDKELQDYSDAMKNVTDRYGTLGNTLLIMNQRTQSNITYDKLKNEYDKNYLKLLKERSEEEKRILQSQKSGEIGAEEARLAIKSMNEQIKNAVPEELKPRFDAYLEATGNATERSIKFSEILYKLQTPIKMLDGAFKFTTGLISSYQSSTSSLQFALDLATTSASTFASALKFLGDHKTELTAFALVAGPEAAAAMGFLTEASGLAGEALGFIATNIMPIMNKQVMLVSTAFKDAASVGGLMVGGFTELKDTAHAAGVDMSTFSKMMKDNSEDLATFGGDVVNGAKRIAAVSTELAKPNVMGANFRQRFVELGYSVEEIPGIIAKVGADVSKTVGGATNTQVAQAVADYAKNLRVISDLTGQNAKTLQDKADNDFKELRYQQYLNDLEVKFGADYRKNVELQFAALPEATKATVKDIMATGSIFSEGATQLTNIAPEIGNTAFALVDLVGSGKALGTQITELSASTAKVVQSQLLNAKDQATAGVAAGALPEGLKLAADSLKAFSGLAQLTLKQIADAKKPTEEKSTDQKLKDLAQAEIDGMQAKISLENAAVGALGPYVKAVNALNEKTLALVHSFSVFADLLENYKPKAQQAAGGIVGNITNEENDAEMQRRIRQLTSQQQNTALTNLQQENAARASNPFLQPTVPTTTTTPGQPEFGTREYYELHSGGEFAVGGIARGPFSGYPATLHGTEAVLPPDLTAMLIDASQTRQPATLHGTEAVLPPDLTAMLIDASQTRQSENSRITELLAANSNFGEQAQRTTQASDDLMTTLISKVDDLISATKSVANYTEMTAHRIA